MPTKISWADETINPIQSVIKGKSGRGYHCTKVKAGCKNCYAERINNRFGNKLSYIHYNKQSAKVLKTHARRLLKFELVYSQLEKPAKWKKPKRIFVQSMSDLFHENVPFKLIIEILTVLNNSPQHTYILLTKRIKELKQFTDNYDLECWFPDIFKNLWLGVSISTQKDADEMIPILLQIPAAVRFVSVEPILENIELSLNYHSHNIKGHRKLDWVICGIETGSGARSYKLDWIRSIEDQCTESGTPFFLKNPETIDSAEYKQFPGERI